MKPEIKELLEFVRKPVVRIDTRDGSTISDTYPQFSAMLPAQNATPEQWRMSFSLVFLMLKDHESMIYQLKEKIAAMQVITAQLVKELDDATSNQEQETEQTTGGHDPLEEK